MRVDVDCSRPATDVGRVKTRPLTDEEAAERAERAQAVAAAEWLAAASAAQAIEDYRNAPDEDTAREQALRMTGWLQ